MFLRTNDTIFYETSRRDSKQLFRIETISLWILFSNSFSNNNNMYIIALKCTHSFPLKDTREHIIYSIYCRQVNNVNINIVTTTSAHGIYIKCYNNIKTIWYHTIYIYFYYTVGNRLKGLLRFRRCVKRRVMTVEWCRVEDGCAYYYSPRPSPPVLN